MTTDVRGSADRPALEGTLSDLPLFDVLELLAITKQTGTLYVASSSPGALTLVDGEVSFATSDPSASLREVLLQRRIVSDDVWETATQHRDVDLGRALVDFGGTDEVELREAVHEHIVSTVFSLANASEGRFRFVNGSRHSMGPGYAYPIELLRSAVEVRRDQWNAISDVVPSAKVVVQLVGEPPRGQSTVCVAATDWPVVVELDGRRSIDLLVGPTRRSAFQVCQSVHRLVSAGLAKIVD
jgi:hypothetical protein